VTFEGRARWGATFGGYSNNDDYGHGTHVAYDILNHPESPQLNHSQTGELL